MNIRKVVVPVAGWGTRSLPATKNIPKEMLPIYNKPVVQYIVEEAIRSGLDDVVFVTNREKKIIEDHFDKNLQLEALLKRAGKDELLRTVQDVAQMANIISIRQKEQLGLGHAVLCAKDLINEDAFGVMLGDDLMFGMEPGLKQLIQVAVAEGLPVVGVMEVEADKVDQYGIVAGVEKSPGIYQVTDLVEKPAIQDAPSRLAIVGRYILTPEIFPALEQTKAGAGGEIQLTDALRTVAKERGLLAVKMRGMRFDAGNWSEYLTANIYFALQDESIREDLIKHLKPLLP